MHVDWPSPAAVVWATASYVNVPDLDTIPIFPGEWMCPGIIPILHCPGVITPGQFGPINLELDWLRNCLTFIISWTGTPSVMQIMRGIFDAIASSIESAANGGGT